LAGRERLVDEDDDNDDDDDDDDDDGTRFCWASMRDTIEFTTRFIVAFFSLAACTLCSRSKASTTAGALPPGLPAPNVSSTRLINAAMSLVAVSAGA
jgi:hypothetical protein